MITDSGRPKRVLFGANKIVDLGVQLVSMTGVHAHVIPSVWLFSKHLDRDCGRPGEFTPEQ